MTVSVLELLLSCVAWYYSRHRWLGWTFLCCCALHIAHNVYHESGVIVNATSTILLACIVYWIGSHDSIAGNLLSTQIISPIILALMGMSIETRRFTIPVAMLSFLNRPWAGLRIFQSFLLLIGSSVYLQLVEES